MSAFVEEGISPATEYYDPMNAQSESSHHQQHHPHISIHEPTPQYERHPSFPQPVTLTDEKVGYGRAADGYPASDMKSMTSKSHHGLFHRKAASVASGHTHTSAAGSARQGSIASGTLAPRTPREGLSPTGSGRVSLDSDVVLAPNVQSNVKRGGTWAHGPGTSGREESGLRRGQSLAERATNASQYMNEKERMALSKAELKDAKRLSKIIKAEGKAEDKQLKGGLKELGSLQRAQKKASANETAAVTAHGRAAKEERAASAAYLEAKTRFERAQANLKVTEERLELAREQAEKTTVMVKRQAEEVETLRERKATDDRERSVKLANLKAGVMSPTEY